MKIRNRRPYAFVAAALVATVGLGAAACNRHSPEHRAEWITGKIASELDLNDAQKVKLDAVKTEFLAVRKEVHKDRAQTFKDLIAQVRAKDLDTRKLQAIVEAKTKAVETASPRVIGRIAEFHASLSEQQRDKLATKLEELQAKIQRWHGEE
jgi:Spy/CpxP family protein refolding chaperone